MGMIEKQTLIDSITVRFAEDFNLSVKDTKAKLTEILQNYHVTISNETYVGNDTSTDFLLQKFKEGKRAIGMSDGTLKQYEIAVQKLEKITNKSLADTEPEDINNFLRLYGKEVSSVTLRAKYQLLSSVYNYLFQHRYISYNPILYVDVPKATVVYKTPMTDIDLEKVKHVCENLPEKESNRDMALLYFFISTGCRVSEVTNVKIKDINFENKTCKVLGKGRKERPVILSDKCIYRLKLYLEHRKDCSPNAPLFTRIKGKETTLTKDGVGNIIRKLTETAGTENITCHSFRRYYATELRKRNVNIQMIASSLGHANLNQINRYSIYSKNEMLDVIRTSL